ncbi:MAG TPA: DNA alkylation repair protein [Gemmatimonadaceae bacterium]|nr:DNA alkylation repair protein [Gemmatimonadaceae bacterium]
MNIPDNESMISVHARDAQRDLHALNRIDASSVRAVQREYARKLKPESPDAVIQFVRMLVAGGSWAQHVVAWETLASHKAAFARVDDELVEEMAHGLSDWPSVDLYGVTIVGRAWNKGQVSDAEISSWTESDDRWRRRLALVSTVPLNAKSRGGAGDIATLLRERNSG